MSEAIPFEQPSPERLTWKQIRERYPDEWVVLVDTEWENEGDFEFGTTLVYSHHKGRKECTPFVKAAFEHYEEVGTFFTGKLIKTIGLPARLLP